MNIEGKLYHYKAIVDRVIDGDTVEFSEIDLGFSIKMKSIRGRLIGIDAPETRTKDLEEKANGLMSKAYLQTLLEGKEVIIASREYSFKDNFGRLLVDIYLNDEHINMKMLLEGYAVPYEK